MRFLGGKSRIAKPLAAAIASASEIEREREDNVLVSLFCGGCSVEAALSPYFDRMILNDNHKYLIALLRGVQNGYELPDFVSREEYNYRKTHREENRVMTGFVGFGSSFGGKFFGGYGNSTYENITLQSKKSLLRNNKKLKNAFFTCQDYRDVILPPGCVVYADPPYNNTTQFGGKKFNTEDFWEYARRISQDHLVFVSELDAPDDFVSVWEKPIRRQLCKDKEKHFLSTEHLYIHQKWEK